MQDPAISLLAELVAIDSVNPALVPGGAGEAEIAAFVADRLRSARLDVETEEAAPGRPNVVGILQGKSPGRALVLCGHLDTVGVEGMSGPFSSVIREGGLYGRGAEDMKGGLAAILSAAENLAREGLAAGRLIVAAVADEEPHAQDRILSFSRPAEGEDAILRMGRVLGRLEALGQELFQRKPHALLGAPSLHASLVDGGRELSTYPDRCLLSLERRTLPGEGAGCGLEEVRGILEALSAEDPAFRGSARRLFAQPAYETPEGHPIVEVLDASLTAVGRASRRGGMTYWTDAAILGAAGIPSVIFGPSGAGLHGLEEYVLLDQVTGCRDVLIETIRRFCGRSEG